MNSLFRSRESSVRQTSDTRAEQKATYRFLSNENVTESELIESCCERTSQLCKDKHLLVLNDTTEINLQRHSGRMQSKTGIGLVGNNKDLGFFAHIGLVIDILSYQAIGFSSINLWHRDLDKEDKTSRNYDKLPIEEKESFKWIKCSNDSKYILQDAASITIVGDRESDIYELFIDAKEKGVDVLARNRTDRKIQEGEKLYKTINNTKNCGSFEIKITGDNRKNKQKRKATLDVKFTEVLIKKPENKKDNRPENIKVWLVEAKENGKENGICW